jgi:lipopolysaccharide/colanic/teichoic acid biosynthesis glycosyltransferase
MIQKGYAGLPDPRTASDKSRTLVETPGAGLPSAPLEPARHNNLKVVLVDRRAPDRAIFLESSQAADADGSLYHFSKRIFDVVFASLAIIVLSPLIIGIVICAYVSSGAPLFKHRRVGKDGRFFNCIKFRTMVPDADRVLQNLLSTNRDAKEEWLRDHKLRNDPRVTRLGRFLRRTSLDELPQLWNVLRGEMSLVGPRPVVPDELRRYGNKVGTFLSATPGITGLWQVSGRNDTDYRRRVALDVCYVRSRSLLLDVYILIKTLPAVFARSGAY